MPSAPEGTCAAYVQRSDPGQSGEPELRDHPGDLLSAAKRLGIVLTRVDVRNTADLPKAFVMIRASGADAILMLDDPALAGSAGVRKEVIRSALERRLPLASSSWRVAPDGGLVSLGADNATLSRRAAFYAHRILSGAKPADLPVERADQVQAGRST